MNVQPNRDIRSEVQTPEQSPSEKGFIFFAYTAVTACAENRNNARNLSHQQANLLVIEGNPVTPVEEQMHKLVVKSGF